MKTVTGKLAVVTIFVLLFAGCGGGGGGSGDSAGSSSGGGGGGDGGSSSNSFITCTPPYQKCAEIDSSDMRNFRFTFPQLKVRIEPALGIGYFFYEIAGSGAEKSLVFTQFNKPVTQDGLTVEYIALPDSTVTIDNAVPVFKLTWKGEEIFVTAIGLLQFLANGMANFAILEVAGNFDARTSTESISNGIFNNLILFKSGDGFSFDFIGEQANWHDVACNELGDCNQPNVLVKWLGDYNFLIDY